MQRLYLAFSRCSITGSTLCNRLVVASGNLAVARGLLSGSLLLHTGARYTNPPPAAARPRCALRHTWLPGPAHSPASLPHPPFAADAVLCCCCPPQVWLKGLLALARGTTIWAIATELPSDGSGRGHFKRKLEDTDRWASDGQCRVASFDPCYELPEGTRATSILDWEAKQFAIAQEQNGLVVKRFVGASYDGEGVVADWYPVPHTATNNKAEDV